MSFVCYTAGVTDAPPKAVCLDLDNTLYPYIPAHKAGMEAVFSKLKNTLGLEQSIIDDCFMLARTQVKKQLGSTASSHSRLLYFQRTLELLGLKTQVLMALDLEQTYWRGYLRNCRLFDGVRDFFYALRAADISTAIITDLTAQIQFRKLVYLELDSLIDHVVTSEEAGSDKPAETAFLLALHKTGCPAEQAWMIGDAREDMLGAKEVGMIAVLKSDTLPENLHIDIKFQNFLDLLSIINKV